MPLQILVMREHLREALSDRGTMTEKKVESIETQPINAKDGPRVSQHLHFTFSHLADDLIQSDLQ